MLICLQAFQELSNEHILFAHYSYTENYYNYYFFLKEISLLIAACQNHFNYGIFK